MTGEEKAGVRCVCRGGVGGWAMDGVSKAGWRGRLKEVRGGGLGKGISFVTQCGPGWESGVARGRARMYALSVEGMGSRKGVVAMDGRGVEWMDGWVDGMGDG